MIRFKVENHKSKIDGTGCFAAQRIPARKKIGQLGGEIVSVRVARQRIKQQKKVAMVEFGDGFALDASVNANALRYLNHSCAPNTYMRCCYQKVEFYSLRPIQKGEELTCNYGETHHEGKRRCTCGAPNCVGKI